MNKCEGDSICSKKQNNTTQTKMRELSLHIHFCFILITLGPAP